MTRQTQIPGTEPPDRNPEIDAAIEAKYERLAALKLAREAVQISDATLLELVEELGAPYPFLEPGTGKRKTLRLDAKKKLKTVASKSAKTEQADREWEAAQAEARGGEPQDAARDAWASEVKERRHGKDRKADTEMYAAEAARAAADPFASTREAMDTDDANVVDQRAEATRRGRKAPAA